MTTIDARRADVFPTLDDRQLERVEPYGSRVPMGEGEVLFRPGDSETSFYVVLSGEVTITVPQQDKSEQHVVTHTPGQFTGEINMFSGRKNLVYGRVTGAGEAIALSPEQFRKLLAQDYELSEVIMRSFILRRVSLIETASSTTVLVGSSCDPETMRLRQFLARNGHPFEFLDLEEDEDAQEALDAFGSEPADLPIVILGGQLVLRQPTNRELGDVLGVSHDFDSSSERYDLAIVGAGPSGLAAAVYGASEGLKVIALEGEAWGGQAGTSSKIENYLGFPTGISGQALAARGYTQAQKFGAEIAIPHRVEGIDCSARPFRIMLQGGEELFASSVVVASGADYRRLPIDELARFEGKGIHYGATRLEAMMCKNEEVIVVGGGNSAGQAAVFLAEQAKRVHLVVRRDNLVDTMSRYLITRIESHPHITLHHASEVVELHGEDLLESVTIRHNPSGEKTKQVTGHVFTMIGASPNTEWLEGCVALDDDGFVKTGSALTQEELEGWPGDRAPYMVETSVRGIFAVGDVRSGSVKRVASAVGEGSIAVQFVHRALSEGS